MMRILHNHSFSQFTVDTQGAHVMLAPVIISSQRRYQAVSLWDWTKKIVNFGPLTKKL